MLSCLEGKPFSYHFSLVRTSLGKHAKDWHREEARCRQIHLLLCHLVGRIPEKPQSATNDGIGNVRLNMTRQVKGQGLFDTKKKEQQFLTKNVSSYTGIVPSPTKTRLVQCPAFLKAEVTLSIPSEPCIVPGPKAA
mmetsp:Transcript_28419/g.43389  ORF Transcript_28419/g.43389 Transcript_28419/m.43389 type:complete len:136 (-) Transcript_28419:2222-2629(-)